MKRTIRLRLVKFDVSFRYSEMTNFDMLKPKPKLKPGDAVLLVSQSRTQMVFIYGYTEFGRNGHASTCLASERLRLTSGSWNPLMLANYASQVGLHLDGLDRFETLFIKEHPQYAVKK